MAEGATWEMRGVGGLYSTVWDLIHIESLVFKKLKIRKVSL